MDIITYALCKKYVDKTADALGAVKGAPAVISSIDDNENNFIVTFTWTGTSGAQEESTITIPKGQDGYSPEITVESESESEYILRIKTKKQEFLTPNLKGTGAENAITKQELEEELEKVKISFATPEDIKKIIFKQEE